MNEDVNRTPITTSACDMKKARSVLPANQWMNFDSHVCRFLKDEVFVKSYCCNRYSVVINKNALQHCVALHLSCFTDQLILSIDNCF